MFLRFISMPLDLILQEMKQRQSQEKHERVPDMIFACLMEGRKR